MRELKYAILGLVNRSPVTGYDITKAFNDSLSKFWEAKHSQIYPELKRLVDEGLVEFEVCIHGERLKTKHYSITEKGHGELLQWLRSCEPLEPVPKEAFRLKLYFGESLTAEDLSSVLKCRLEQYEQRLATLEEKLASFGGEPEKFTPDFSEFLLIRGGILRDRAYIDWLRYCGGLLDLDVS